MYKYIAGFLLGITISISGIALAATTSFPDVSSNDWFAPGVDYVSKNNIMTGYDNGNFGPNDTVNRAELATILSRTESANVIVELAAIRQHDTMALKGSSWETYHEEYTRFPVRGIQFGGEGTIEYNDVKDRLEEVASSYPITILSDNNQVFYIQVYAEMYGENIVYGPFYDDVDRIISEMQE